MTFTSFRTLFRTFCIILLCLVVSEVQSKKKKFNAQDLDDILSGYETQAQRRLDNVLEVQLSAERYSQNSYNYRSGFGISENFNSTHFKNAFRKFMFRFRKSYNLTEIGFRFGNFIKNLRRIEAANQNYERDLSTYELEVNKFADWDQHELGRLTRRVPDYYNRIESNTFDNKPQSDYTKPRWLSSPGIWVFSARNDWRDSGCVTPVRDQGICGSSYAFSTLGVIETMICLQNGTKVILAPQQVIDCSRKNYGCNGGQEIATLDYLNKRGVIALEEHYKYRQRAGNCKDYYLRDHSVVRASISNIGSIRYRKIKGASNMETYLRLYGPLAGSVYANFEFQFYKKGIYTERSCKSSVNHAVIIVGFGEEKGLKYWIVKNSYGKDWGDEGYVKIKRGDDCSIESEAYYIYDF